MTITNYQKKMMLTFPTRAAVRGNVVSVKLSNADKAWLLELILSVDKEQTSDMSSHELAGLIGRKAAIIELYKKVIAL